jgi:hypothetical protein
MEIKRSGSQPSGRGSADYFTGAVRFDPLFTAPGCVFREQRRAVADLSGAVARNLPKMTL